MLQVADELANVVAEDEAGSPSPSSKRADAQIRRPTARRQSVALEADGLAKLQAGLQQAPEQVAAAKSAEDAALKALTATPEPNAPQADLVSARSDPLWQYFLRRTIMLSMCSVWLRLLLYSCCSSRHFFLGAGIST